MSKFLCIVFASVIYCGCRDDDCSKDLLVDAEQRMTLIEKISDIESEVVDLTNPSDLFESELFLKIYENSDEYINDVLSILSDANISEQRKYIAVYSMQRLEEKKYKEFFLDSALLYEDNVLSGELIGSIISSGFGKQRTRKSITRNYTDKRIRKALKNIQNNKKTPAYLSQYIESLE